MLSVANFNTHAGVDGWGRPFDLVAVCRSLDADILVLEEAWRVDGQPQGQTEEVAATLGYQLVTHDLAEGRRARPNPEASARWRPPIGLHNEGNALFFDGVRPLPAALRSTARFQEATPGRWGIAVLLRPHLSLQDTRILHLPGLSRDKVRRAAIVVDTEVEGQPLSVVGTHMSHLHMGSHRHYADLKQQLRTGARPDAVLLGDMNLWGPPVRAFLPEWHRAVKGRTWPSWNPHSQIDHILVRGAVGVVSGEVLADAGSDHRPVRAVLTLG